jgi:hypothetical protein
LHRFYCELLCFFDGRALKFNFIPVGLSTSYLVVFTVEFSHCMCTVFTLMHLCTYFDKFYTNCIVHVVLVILQLSLTFYEHRFSIVIFLWHHSCHQMHTVYGVDVDSPTTFTLHPVISILILNFLLSITIVLSSTHYKCSFVSCFWSTSSFCSHSKFICPLASHVLIFLIVPTLLIHFMFLTTNQYHIPLSVPVSTNSNTFLYVINHSF